MGGLNNKPVCLSDFKVGQTAYFLSFRNGFEPQPVTVTKVARVYIHTDDGRTFHIFDSPFPYAADEAGAMRGYYMLVPDKESLERLQRLIEMRKEIARVFSERVEWEISLSQTEEILTTMRETP